MQRMAAVNNVASVEEEGRERASGTHHLRARAPVKGLRAVRKNVFHEKRRHVLHCSSITAAGPAQSLSNHEKKDAMCDGESVIIGMMKSDKNIQATEEKYV